MASKEVGTHLRKEKGNGVTALRNAITFSREGKFFTGMNLYQNDKVELLRRERGFVYVKAIRTGACGWVQAKHLETPSVGKMSAASPKRTLTLKSGNALKGKPTESKRFRIVSYGNKKHLVCLVKDPFGDKGATVQKMLSESLTKIGVSKPRPGWGKTWTSWKNAGSLRVHGLKPMANKILRQIQQEHPDVAYVMKKHRDHDCKDVNVYHSRGSKGRHADAQPYGRLNFVFSTGLSARGSAWLGAQGVDYRTGQTNGGFGGQQVTMKIESGDCWVMEGKTPHCIHECISGTSPPVLGEWLANQRASVLIRQKD